MLLNSKDIVIVPPAAENGGDENGLKKGHSVPFFIADPEKSLSHSIGKLTNGNEHHFYSWGSFNLVRMICYLIKQTGPVHLFMTSYSFSRKSIEQIQNRIYKNEILSFKVILDNRVRVMSPKPFQMIAASFNYRCISVHAKIALLWNDEWKISIITSQNATDNPKLERGVIFTAPEVFDFDFKTLSNEFERGTT
jgi:hypothetical protein